MINGLSVSSSSDEIRTVEEPENIVQSLCNKISSCSVEMSSF